MQEGTKNKTKGKIISPLVYVKTKSPDKEQLVKSPSHKQVSESPFQVSWGCHDNRKRHLHCCVGRSWDSSFLHSCSGQCLSVGLYERTQRYKPTSPPTCSQVSTEACKLHRRVWVAETSFLRCHWTFLPFAFQKSWHVQPCTIAPERRHAGFIVTFKSPFWRESVRKPIEAPSRTMLQGQHGKRVLHWRPERKIRIFDFKPPGDSH